MINVAREKSEEMLFICNEKVNKKCERFNGYGELVRYMGSRILLLQLYKKYGLLQSIQTEVNMSMCTNLIRKHYGE